MKRTNNKPVVPAFATEAEEAEWWYRNRNKLDKEMSEAVRAGAVKVLDRKTLAKRMALSKASRVISIRLPESDLDLARRQAARRGLPYQTYIKSLLHQVLEQNAKSR